MSEKTLEQQKTETKKTEPQNEEQRIAEQRLQDLMQQASDAAAQRQEAIAEANALRGELERANAEVVALRAQVERLTAEIKAHGEAATQRDALPSLPLDLPKGAAQLTESVTIAVIGDDGKVTRANARRGDVVVVSAKQADVDQLRRAVGVAARVYAVAKETADELRQLKYVR